MKIFSHGMTEKLKNWIKSTMENILRFSISYIQVIGSGALKSLQKFNIDFPMVKWSDDSPWLIEDLKKLEAVDSYE